MLPKEKHAPQASASFVQKEVSMAEVPALVDDASPLFGDAVDRRSNKEASIYDGMGVVYIKEEHVEEHFVGAKEASHPSETDSRGTATEDTAAGVLVNTKIMAVKKFQDRYPNGSKFQQYLSLERCGGPSLSPGWCVGKILCHYDNCVMIQFRLDKASEERIDGLEEWPLEDFVDEVLPQERRGRKFIHRQYGIEEVLHAFDLWNVDDEDYVPERISTISFTDEIMLLVPQSYRDRRVAKFFDGKLYLGTVTGYRNKKKVWTVNYDDGDREEFNAEDLKLYLELYAMQVEPESEPAAGNANSCHKNTKVSTKKGRKTDSQLLKKVLHTLDETELSKLAAKILKPVTTVVADSATDGVASSDTNVAFDDAVSQELEDDEKSAAPEDEPLEPCDTGESPSTEEKEYTESTDEHPPNQDHSPPAEFLAAEEKESTDSTERPPVQDQTPPGKFELALCKSQSKWAKFPIECPVTFMRTIPATVECVYLNLQEKVYRYGIKLSESGNHLQVKETHLAFAPGCPVVYMDKHAVVVTCPSSAGDKEYSLRCDLDKVQEGDLNFDTEGMLAVSNDSVTRKTAAAQINPNLRTLKTVATSPDVSGIERADPKVAPPATSMKKRNATEDTGRHKSFKTVAPQATSLKKRKAAEDIERQKSVQTTHAPTKKPRIDPEYAPRVHKESRELVVETPALRRPFKKHGKFLKLGHKR